MRKDKIGEIEETLAIDDQTRGKPRATTYISNGFTITEPYIGLGNIGDNVDLPPKVRRFGEAAGWFNSSSLWTQTRDTRFNAPVEGMGGPRRRCVCHAYTLG